MVLSCRNSRIKTRLMQIRKGIFQSDSLSPLLFCMALNPLSKELKKTAYDYRMTTGHGETAQRQLISRLLYMDDLKLYDRNSDQLDGLLYYRFSLTVLASFIGGAWTCSSSINRPESSSLCTVPTILLHTLTDCTLLAVMGVGGYNRLSRHINLVL